MIWNKLNKCTAKETSSLDIYFRKVVPLTKLFFELLWPMSIHRIELLCLLIFSELTLIMNKDLTVYYTKEVAFDNSEYSG